MPNQRRDNLPSFTQFKDRLHTRGTRMRGRDVEFSKMLLSQVRKVYKDVINLITENGSLKEEVATLRQHLAVFKRHYHDRGWRSGRNRRR